MKRNLLSLLVAVLTLLLATALGLGVICITDQPYKSDISRLKISESSGFTEEKISENYSAVIDFLSPFSNKPFDLPSMKYSPSGAGHFEDCKPIFNGVYLLGLLSAVLLAVLIWQKRLTHTVLRRSGIITLAIPAVFGVGVLLNFDRLFVLFHKLFFGNDDWLFDPATDEIINILPEEFFMHCAVFIAAFWVLAAALQLIIGCKSIKK